MTRREIGYALQFAIAGPRSDWHVSGERLRGKAPGAFAQFMFKTFQLSELLRYAFSGSIFLATFAGSMKGISSVLTPDLGKERVASLIMAAFVAGSLCYSLHRAFYRLIILRQMCKLSHETRDSYRVAFEAAKEFFCGMFKWDGKWSFGTALKGVIEKHKRAKEAFRKEEFDRDYARWVRGCNFPAFQERMSLWAAHVHFLYCSAWAALAGAFIGRLILSMTEGKNFFTDHPGLYTFWGALVFAIVLLFVGFSQDTLLTFYDLKLAEKEMVKKLDKDIKKQPEQKPPGSALQEKGGANEDE